MTPQPLGDESPREQIARVRRAVSSLETVSPEEAEAMGARPMTDAYVTRMYDQCVMLMKEVEESKGKKILLVRTARGIAIWRAKP